MAWWNWYRRWLDRPDDAWHTTGIKPMERSWDISRDHNDPRAKRQLMAEGKARQVQAQRRGEKAGDVREFPRRQA